MKEDIAQLKVSVPIRDLWKAMSSDIKQSVAKVLPDVVEEVELLEGDGGHGSILLFKFFPHVPKVNYQKEKIVEYNDSLHQIALEILEGGHLDHGLTRYTNVFKLTALGEAETMIDFKVVYEAKPEHTYTPGELTMETLHYLKLLENYLLTGLS